MPIIDELVKDFPYSIGTIPFDLADIPRTECAVVAFSSNRWNDVLIPDEYFLGSHGYLWVKDEFQKGNTWNKRRNEVFWRGSTTGEVKSGDSWRSLQRAKLCMIAARSALPMNIGFSAFAQLDKLSEKEIQFEGIMKEYCAPDALLKYKYHVDIDGNSNSWPGFFLKLLSGGTTFKVRSEFNYKQWYYDDLIPNEHYIEVSSDLKDFEDKVAGAMEDQMKSKKIAENAYSFAFDMEYSCEIKKAASAININFLQTKSVAP